MVRPIAAADVRPLRAALLRPDTPPDALVYPGDDHADALHVGAFDGGPDGAERLVGVASVFPEPPPEERRDRLPASAFAYGAAFRLRGMATLPEVRGAGHGRALLEACFDHVRARGAEVLWCDARIGALAFYQAMGLVAEGAEYEVPGAGRHHFMWREV